MKRFKDLFKESAPAQDYKRDEDNLLKVDREIKQLINEMELLETKKNEV